MKLQLLILFSHVIWLWFPSYTPKIGRNKRKRHTIINMQKLWRRDYNFNVNKDQLPILPSTRIFAMKELINLISII